MQIPANCPVYNNFLNRSGNNLLLGIIEYELKAKTSVQINTWVV